MECKILRLRKNSKPILIYCFSYRYIHLYKLGFLDFNPLCYFSKVYSKLL